MRSQLEPGNWLQIPQYRTTLDGLDSHVVHVRSPHEGAPPLVMTHGWPGSVVEFPLPCA